MHSLKALISDFEERQVTYWDQLKYVMIVAVIANLAMANFDSTLMAGW